MPTQSLTISISSELLEQIEWARRHGRPPDNIPDISEWIEDQLWSCPRILHANSVRRFRRPPREEKPKVADVSPAPAPKARRRSDASSVSDT